MEGRYCLGESPEGIDEVRAYLYRTQPSRLSPSALMCVFEAARDTLRARETEIVRLRNDLSEAKQGQLFAVAGGAS